MHIDVVIPVYGHVHLVPKAIESLQQQGVPLHLKVIDDGNDPAVGSLDSYIGGDVTSIDVLRLTNNCGISAARNIGLSQCHGEAVIFLDADDELQPGGLQVLASTLQEHQADAVYGFVEEFGMRVSSDRVAKASTQPVMLAGSTLMRRSSVLALGSFDETLRVGEFIDLMARAQRREWMIVPINVPVLRRRLHDRNTSWVGGSADFLRVVRRHIAGQPD